MNRTISLPDSIAIDEVAAISFFHFLQQIANRKAVGSLRYERNGRPNRRKKYLSRLKKELMAYERRGNHENLLNIAGYAFLESYAPENGRYHFNPTVESATRREFGGETRRD